MNEGDNLREDDPQTRFARREMIVFLTIFSIAVIIGFIILLIFLMRLPSQNG